jgi:hypothetical protein
MKVGDRVIVSQLFTAEGGGRMIDVEPFVAKIIKVQEAATFGTMYLLENASGETLNIWYTSDLVVSLQEAEDELWRAWGDK